MRGQMSIELLFNFVILLAVISSLFLVLSDFHDRMKKENEIIDETMHAEKIARISDMLASTGRYKTIIIEESDTDQWQEIKYKIENDIVILEYKEKTITASTIFNKRENNGQHI